MAEAAPDNFRFQGKALHLTFSTHLNHETILQLFRSKGAVKWYSICHESSDELNAYDHTHAACGWHKRLNARGARAWDIGAIHPHIQPIVTEVHAIRIFEEYHKKQDPTILLSQSEISPKAAAISYEGIRSAPNLMEACQAMGIEVKTVSDVNTIRQDKPRAKDFEHDFRDTIWTIPAPGIFRAILLYGPSGTGKTQFAVHLFECPLVVSHMDQLRDFDASRHDGIVFDDMSFAHMPREAVIHLLDWDLDRAIHCRYSPAIIPKHTRKVFTSNKRFEDIFPHDDAGAIRRRVSRIIHVHGLTYAPHVANQVEVIQEDAHEVGINLPGLPGVHEQPIDELGVEGALMPGLPGGHELVLDWPNIFDQEMLEFDMDLFDV